MRILSVLALFSVFLLSSCTKEVVKNNSVPGIWEGTYTVDQAPSQAAMYYSLVVYPNGTIITKGKGGDGADYFSKGTWSLSSGNLFTASVTTFTTSGSPITQSITATFSNGNLIDGVWRDTVNPYGLKSGKYSTFKKVD